MGGEKKKKRIIQSFKSVDELYKAMAVKHGESAISSRISSSEVEEISLGKCFFV